MFVCFSVLCQLFMAKSRVKCNRRYSMNNNNNNDVWITLCLPPAGPGMFSLRSFRMFLDVLFDSFNNS